MRPVNSRLLRSVRLVGFLVFRRPLPCPSKLDRFGRTLFGHSTLIARKLIDEGVRFVNATWDLDDSGASTRRWW